MQEGVTEGLWVSHLPDEREPAAACGGGGGGGGGEGKPLGEAETGRCSAAADRRPATLLIDTEGLGAPGSDVADYGSKLVPTAPTTISGEGDGEGGWAQN